MGPPPLSAPGIWASTHLLGVGGLAQGSWKVAAGQGWILPTGSPYILPSSELSLRACLFLSSQPFPHPPHPPKWVKNSQAATTSVA